MKIPIMSKVESRAVFAALPSSHCFAETSRRARESRATRLGGGFVPQPSTLPPSVAELLRRTGNPQPVSGFTLVEIAICLAIIGIALVAIIGVLPMGINVQRDNREETIINQDATVLIETIRNGARGVDDLTNYVFAITNSRTPYNPIGPTVSIGYNYSTTFPINNGTNIIGLLSTPEYTNPKNNAAPIDNLPIFSGSYDSNYIVAYVRSISGPASEKPPQDNNGTIRGDSFSYKIICENVPVAVAGTTLPYDNQLTANLHELRLTFLWPQLPNGSVGPKRQTFRTTVAGQLVQDTSNTNLYFFQSQSFTNAP